MPAISDNALDAGLEYIRTNTEEFHICSQEPTDVTEATTTYSLGNKVGPTIDAPSDDISGRKVTIQAIADGNVTASGTVTHYALVKTSATAELLATGTIPSKTVTNGNTFTTTAANVNIQDPT